jgi:hypothetical protein
MISIPSLIASRTDQESIKICESLELLARIKKTVRYVFVMPMFREERRLRPRSEDNPFGEDALRRKIMQINFLQKLNPNVMGRIIAVDDGSPQASSAACVRQLWAEIQTEYRKQGRPLDKDLLSVLVITEDEKKRLQSKKGAAILLGLRRAIQDGWATHVGYTDVDYSTNLLQIPLILTPVLEEKQGAAVGSCWIAGGFPVGVSFRRRVLSKIFNLIVHLLLPPLRDIRDTQRAFKIFDAAVLKDILSNASEPGFALDTELLVLTKLSGKSIREVPIAWVDSAKASTIRLWTDSLQMMAGILKQSRHLSRTSRDDTALSTKWLKVYWLVVTSLYVIWRGLVFLKKIQ